jgi:hypothetical protein
MFRLSFIFVWAIMFSGCATISRTSRPASFILAESKAWEPKNKWANHWMGAVLPAGRYIYAWEDSRVWYYEPESGPILTKWIGGLDYTEPGAIGLYKNQDIIVLFQYLTPRQFSRREGGELTYLLLPKHGDRRVCVQFVIPDDIRKSFEEGQAVPIPGKN